MPRFLTFLFTGTFLFTHKKKQKKQKKTKKHEKKTPEKNKNKNLKNKRSVWNNDNM